MALQSQTARSTTGVRNYSSTGRGRSGSGKRVLGVVLLLGVVGGGLILLTKTRDNAGGGSTSIDLSPRSAQANPAALTANPGPGPSSDPMVPTLAKPPVSEPSELRMSSPARVGEASPTLVPVVNTQGGRTTAPEPATSTGRQSLPGVDATDPMGTAPAESSSTPASTTSPEVTALTQAAEKAQASGKLVEARASLNKALMLPNVPVRDRDGLRQWASRLNQDILFSPTYYPGDTMTEKYTVVKGDSLPVIARKRGTISEPLLIARVNKMSNPDRLSIGQSLKLVKGPFHAVVSKSAFRMDVYAGPVSAGSGAAAGLPDGVEPGWTYITSFPVGLGERSSTPLATFALRDHKLVNPTWVNPRTGQKYAADDPTNPIGERWIGLEGMDEASKAFQGYGIHGTVQPESIGTEMSMGCVRMKAEDVEQVYELLMPRVSVVKIVP